MEIIRGPDAGELDQRVRLLAFRSLRCCGGRTLCAPMENKCGACAGEGWKWSEYRKAWARVTPTGAFTLYADSGVSGQEAEFILRRQGFTLRNAIRWRGLFYLPISLTPVGRGHLAVKAVQVRPRRCKGEERGTGREIRFDAVCGEKLQEHQLQGPMARNTVRLALVTPAEVALQPGSLVTVGDDPAPWWVKICHEPERERRETEIERIVEP